MVDLNQEKSRTVYESRQQYKKMEDKLVTNTFEDFYPHKGNKSNYNKYKSDMVPLTPQYKNAQMVLHFFESEPNKLHLTSLDQG